jgi:type II secretory pathway pseudopilin PulG
MGQQRSTAGITLLELLLAIGIMAMIAVGLSTLFDTGGQVWRRVEANSSVADYAVNRNELRRHLEAMPVVTIDVPLDQIFISEDSGFAVQVNREGDPEWISVNASLPKLGFVRSQVNHTLRPDVSRIEFSFYGRKSVRDVPAWHDNWRSAAILPILIKIESWDTDGAANPPLTIQPGKRTRQMEISLSSLVPPN